MTAQKYAEDARRITSLSQLNVDVVDLTLSDPRKVSPSTASTKSPASATSSLSIPRKSLPDMKTLSPPLPANPAHPALPIHQAPSEQQQHLSRPQSQPNLVPAQASHYIPPPQSQPYPPSSQPQQYPPREQSQQYIPPSSQQYIPLPQSQLHMPPPQPNLSTLPEDQNTLLAPTLPPLLLPPTQQFLTPRPYSSGSPTGSRPTSQGSVTYSRPGSRDPSQNRNFSQPGSRDRSQVRDISRPISRSQSPNMGPPALTVDSKLKKHRSWLPGTTVQIESPKDGKPINAPAWLVTPTDKIPYDTSELFSFKNVSELWDSNGDTLVYLHSDPSGPEASFRVDSACFASSRKLVKAAHGQTRTLAHSRQTSREFQQPQQPQQLSFAERAQGLVPGQTLSPTGAPRAASSDRSSSSGGQYPALYLGEPAAKQEIHLCLPQPLAGGPNAGPIVPGSNDAEILVTVRNLFAFLSGKPLLATTRRPSLFAIFMHVSEILQRYEFTNFDGSTLGEEAVGRFAEYLQRYRIGDVRTSREQTIEAILLGERMKCWELYNEGYVHAVGKYQEIATYKSPKTAQISDLSRKRLERSHLFLSTRLRNVRDRLQDFDFPALWAGFANSTSSSESKSIRFKAWRGSFLSMRKHVMDFYKQRYGHWPPKASSKKNQFEENGLNRLLLKEVYQDLCDLYNVLADKTNLTPRIDEIPTHDDDDPNETLQRALRRILGEYDRSIPPVQPAIPFDTPWLPTLASTRRDFEKLDARKQKKECTKKLADSEINTALMQSYNRELMKSTSFLESFFAYERRNAHNKSIEEIADQRIGQWLFMYVVIQSLPLVVIDAPGLHFTDGVEYFLSEFSKETAPWLPQDHRRKTTWRIPGSDTMVDMPVASVEHSLDAIYQRSHCWQMAQQWAGPTALISQSGIPEEELLPPVMPSVGHSRTASGSSDKRSSGGNFADRRLSLGVGLEQLPLPSGVGVSPSGSRPTSVYDPSKSFNSILGLQEEKGGKKKK